MNEPIRCKRCGGPLAVNGELGGVCPRCMFQLGFESSFGESENSQPEVDRKHPSIIGRYRILGLIGEGGMGSVYEAEQEHPRRTVALKIIKLGMANPLLLRRFEQESQALGRLQHPGIAQIYEAGTVDTGFGPQPYFAMELIGGRSLLDYSESNHLNTNQRLQIMVKVCEGVQHAHLRGLIHRDLKPGNILVDATGQPKILDFGVARVTDSDARATVQTDLGQLVGTLAYMSPEQALADPLDIDTRSDVYSLGVILYELLSGRMPYVVGKKLQDAIEVVREKDPPLLGTVNRTFRGDIEVIVARALEKDRTRRYASAAELSADIQRHMNDEPIVARRRSASYQLQKFVRRHRALVVGTVSVFLVLVAGVITSTWLLARATRDRDRARRAESLANENGKAAAEARVNEREQRNIAEAARLEAESQTAIAQQALSDVQVNLYHSLIESADREGWASNVSKADRLLEETPIVSRNWEWHHLAQRNHMEKAVIPGHRDAILAMALGPDGKQLRTVSADNTVKNWDLETRKELSTATSEGTLSNVVLGDHGRLLYSRVTVQTGALSFRMSQQLLDLMTGTRVMSRLSSVVALSPNGKRAATASEATSSTGTQLLLRCWDTGTGVDLFEAIEHTEPISHLVFSPDESLLAVMGNGVRILSLPTGREIAAFASSQDTFTVGAFSRDSTIFVAGFAKGGLRAWRLLDGRELWSIPDGNINLIVWSPDSRHIATTGADQTIRLLDSVRGRETARFVGHAGGIHALAFTPSSTQLLSAGDDKLIHIWSLQEHPQPLSLNPTVVEKLAVSPDGKTLWIATETGVKSWDTDTGRVGVDLDVGPSKWKSGFSVDGRPFVLLNKVLKGGDRRLTGHGEIVVLDARSGREIAVFDRPIGGDLDRPIGGDFGPPAGSTVGRDGSEFLVSPDAKRFALLSVVREGQSSSWYTEIQIREAGMVKRSINFRVNQGSIGASRFSPDGKLIAVGISWIDGSKNESRVEIYDTTTGRRLCRLEAGVNQPLFSPVGNQLAVVENRRVISIRDAVTGRKLASTREVGKSGTNVVHSAFSPDGTRLASVSSDGEVWLWDTKTGKELILLHESSGPFVVREATAIATNWLDWVLQRRNLRFSQDGRKITLLTVSPTSGNAVVTLNMRIETWDGTPRQR